MRQKCPQILLDPAKALDLEFRLCRFPEGKIEEMRHVLEVNLGQHLARSLDLLGAARSEADHDPVLPGSLGYRVRGKEVRLLELPQMRPQLIALDRENIFVHGQAPEPFGTDVVIP